MASTKVGIVVLTADGTIRQVINPTDDAELDRVVVQGTETLIKLNKTTYQTFTNMVALAGAQGWKVK